MIVMKETATEEEVEAVVEKIEGAGALAHRIRGARVSVIGAIGDVEQEVSVESLGLDGEAFEQAVSRLRVLSARMSKAFTSLKLSLGPLNERSRSTANHRARSGARPARWSCSRSRQN